jgi:hypothetical protein
MTAVGAPALDFSKCRRVPVTQDDGSVVLMGPPPHVQAGVAWMLDHRAGINGNDMGGMKSATSIIAAQFLFEAGHIDRVIVVTPAAIRSMVWFDPDIGELALHLRDDIRSLVSEFHQKVRQWRRGPENAPRQLRWIVTNYELLRRKEKVETLLPYCGPKTLLLLDESSAVRSHDSAQTEAIMRLRWDGPFWKARPRCGWCWLLNGTPLAEGPEDLFSQGNILDPAIHGCRYITHFRNAYAVLEDIRGPGGRTMVDKRGNAVRRVAGWRNLEDLQRRFAPVILRQDWRRDFPLPGVLPVQAIEVRLSAAEWSAYRDMREDMIHWLEGGGLGIARHAAVKVMRLAQITSGLLGGVEADLPDLETSDPINDELLESLGVDPPPRKAGDRVDLPGSFLDGVVLEQGGADALNAQAAYFSRLRTQAIVEVGRSKLDMLLAMQERMLREDPDTKLLVWFRFVPELHRWLAAAQERFPGVAFGAVCGQSITGRPVREERAEAMRLLHPRTAPPGPAAVGGVYGTGGLGLNFTAFSTVIHSSHIYEDWKRRQADKRLDRPGQRRVVTQFDLVAAGPRGQRTIDHVVLDARRNKQSLNDWTTAAWVRALREE